MKKIYLFLFMLSLCYNSVMAEDNSTCATAIVIPEEGGIISVSYDADQMNYWYSYTAPADKDVIFTVKVPDADSGSSLSINSQSSCDGVMQSQAMASAGLELQVPKGKTCFIDIKQPQFAFLPKVEFSSVVVTVEETVLGGVTCDDALVMKDGENKILANGSNYIYSTWITYTSAITGRFILTFPDKVRIYSVKRYNSCEETVGTTITKTGDSYKIDVTEGERVLLKLDNQETCTATISCQPIEQGDDRTNPLQATLGNENTCKATKVGDHWYKLTTVKDGLLDISVCGMLEPFVGKVLLYRETNVNYQDAGAGVCPEGNGFYLRYEVKANEIYFVNVELSTTMAEDFNFSVANIDYPQGWAKENPVEAVKGDNTCDGLAGTYWYKYTVSTPSYLEASNVGTKDFVGSLSLYNEDGVNQLAYGNKDFDKGGFSFKKNVEPDTYLVKMSITQNSPKFNLIITDSPIEQGSECTNPIPVQTGENECSGKTEVWYTYEMGMNGYLNISTNGTLTNFDGVFKLYKTCDGVAVATATIAEDKTGATLKYKATLGTYLIQWTTVSDIAPFKFTVAEVAFAKGEDCSNPLPASVTEDNPLSLSEAGDTYYSYTSVKDGWMNISICSEAWTSKSGSVEVKTDCEGKSVELQTAVCEDGKGQAWKAKVVAGTPYIICIKNKSAMPDVTAFTLNITDYTEGDVCEKPIELESISEELPVNITKGSVWYQFMADKAGNYMLKSTNLPNGFGGGGIIIGGGIAANSYISIKTGDCSVSEIKSSYSSSTGHSLNVYADEGEKMLVNIVIGAETPNVTWTVTYEEPVEGTVCAKPIKISLTEEGKTIDGIIGGSYADKKSMWYAVTPTENGRLTVATCQNSPINFGNSGSEAMEFYVDCNTRLTENDITLGTCGDDYPMCGEKKSIDVKASETYLVNLMTAYQEPFPIQFSLEKGLVSVDKVSLESLTISPNPNDGAFGVDLSVFSKNDDLTLEISNTQGQIIYKKTVNSSIGNYLVRLNKIVSGIYFLTIKNGDRAITNKFIVK